jgi:hypothetical protein
MMMAIAGGFGCAIALAILLDITDRKIRYPDQATNDLGLLPGLYRKLKHGLTTDRPSNCRSWSRRSDQLNT